MSEVWLIRLIIAGVVAVLLLALALALALKTRRKRRKREPTFRIVTTPSASTRSVPTRPPRPSQVADLGFRPIDTIVNPQARCFLTGEEIGSCSCEKHRQ